MTRHAHRPVITAELSMPGQSVATARAVCCCGWAGTEMVGPDATDAAARQARSHRSTAV